MNLRSHQKDCAQTIDEHLKNNDKGLIKMFCGSGKSFVIYHTILKYGNKLSVIVVPSISLITQFNKDYFLNKICNDYNNEKFKKEFELLSICSKNEIDKKTETNFTTDSEEILEFLEKEEDKIILVTYQSLKTLCDIIKENDMKIDLLCFDEAHHITADGMKKLLFGLDIDDYDDYTDFCSNDDYVNIGSEYDSNSDSSDVCYRCGRNGHYSNNCYAKTNVKIVIILVKKFKEPFK